jgi:hypothetical protein
MVERDTSGDDEDRPLKLTIVKPKKPVKPKGESEPEKVGVGAKSGDEDGTAGDEQVAKAGDAGDPRDDA